MSDELRLKISLTNKAMLMKTYEYLYDKYKGLIAFVVAKYLDNKEDIDDVISDTFLELFNNPNKVNSSIKGFLLITSKGKAIKLLQSKKMCDELKDMDAYITFNSSSEYKLIIEELQNALEENEFKILYLHLVEGDTFKNISNKLSIKESTIKTIYFKTLKKAAKIIGE